MARAAAKCHKVPRCIACRIARTGRGTKFPGGATSPISVIDSRIKSFDPSRSILLAPSPRRHQSLLNRQVINETRREQLRRPRSRCNRSRSYVMFQRFFIPLYYLTRAHVTLLLLLLISPRAPLEIIYFPEASPGLVGSSDRLRVK